jgi:spore germination cell wall hydrolase CwlJ-like protein
MEGVGWVVRNRVESPLYPHAKTYEAVIFDTKFGRQFKEVDHPRWKEAANPAALSGSDAMAYKRAFAVAVGVYYGTIPDPTKGALFFHDTTQPLSTFHRSREQTAQFGKLIFFK